MTTRELVIIRTLQICIADHGPCGMRIALGRHLWNALKGQTPTVCKIGFECSVISGDDSALRVGG